MNRSESPFRFNCQQAAAIPFAHLYELEDEKESTQNRYRGWRGGRPGTRDAFGQLLGRGGEVLITLVDKNRTQIWKPKLHEIAAGSMDFGDHEVDYMAQAHWNHFTFRIGELKGLNRAEKTIELAPYVDIDGVPVTPIQEIAYDTLVVCVGSLSNDFGTQGVIS